MDQYLTAASDVVAQMFGPDSGIPWWAWGFVVVAVMWKFLLPERQTAEERDAKLMAALGVGEDDGKKKKKKK